jgi:hypothetical protein
MKRNKQTRFSSSSFVRAAKPWQWLSLTLLMLCCLIVFSLNPHRLNASSGELSGDRVEMIPATVVGKAGFFRVGRSTQERWWFLDPDNRPFFYKGVTSVGDGRGIFPTTSALSSYTNLIKQKYGGDVERYRKDTFARLRDWNFNALGAWTAEDFFDREMPYTLVLDFAKGEQTPRLTDKLHLPDVFDPQWLKAIDRKAKRLVDPRRDSRLLVGYFTDNELSWEDMEIAQFEPEERITKKIEPFLLQVCLSLDSERSAYQAAWKFVLERHENSLEAVAIAWHIPLESQAQLKQYTANKQALVSPEFLEDSQVFTQAFARRYFEESAKAIHRYDSNHLILGCRFGAPPNEAVFSQVKRPWVDVVSANNYRYNFYDRMDLYYRATQLPVLNTEFSWGHQTFSQMQLPGEPSELSPTERMVRYGEQSLARAFTHPGLVGYTWYRWINRPEYSSSPIELGLITLKDEPNPWHVKLAEKLNARAETITLTDFGR